jgi:hypothetical protein
MKEELQGKLVEILTSIQTAAGKAGEFALEQLPDIAQSYVVYGRVTTVVTTTCLLALAVALVGLARWAYKNPWNTSSYSWDEGKKRSESNYQMMFIPGAVGALCAILAISSFNWLVWFAPKVWLLKEIATLLK